MILLSDGCRNLIKSLCGVEPPVPARMADAEAVIYIFFANTLPVSGRFLVVFKSTPSERADFPCSMLSENGSNRSFSSVITYCAQQVVPGFMVGFDPNYGLGGHYHINNTSPSITRRLLFIVSIVLLLRMNSFIGKVGIVEQRPRAQYDEI